MKRKSEDQNSPKIRWKPPTIYNPRKGFCFIEGLPKWMIPKHTYLTETCDAECVGNIFRWPLGCILPCGQPLRAFFLSIYLEKRSGLGLGLFLDPSAQMIGWCLNGEVNWDSAGRNLVTAITSGLMKALPRVTWGRGFFQHPCYQHSVDKEHHG